MQNVDRGTFTQTPNVLIDTPAKETVIIIRPSFKKICNNDACRAALFNHLLYCIACKVVGGSDYWYGTLEEIHQGIDESWSMGKMRKELDELLKQGIVGQRHNEVKKWDRTLQYFFNKEHAKKLKELCKKLEIDLSSIGLPSQVVHLLNLTNAFVKCDRSIEQKRQMEMSNMADPFVNNGRAIPKVTTKVTSKVTTKKERAAKASPVSASQEKEIVVTNQPALLEQKTEGKPEEVFNATQLEWFNNVWRKCTKIASKRKTVNETLRGHIIELSEEGLSIEQLNSLFDFTSNQSFMKNRTVYPGNLVNAIPYWKQSQTTTNQQGGTVDPRQMKLPELIEYIMNIPTRLDHHDPRYAELQRCMTYISDPDERAKVARKRRELSMQVAS